MDELKEIEKRKIEELTKKYNGDKMKSKIEVNDNNFEKEVIEKSKKVPVVVDFWAEWCMPCLILGPVLEKMMTESKGKFILAKLNVDKNPVTSKAYEIQSIPAVKLFKNGKLADEFVGALPEVQVKDWLDKNLGD